MAANKHFNEATFFIGIGNTTHAKNTSITNKQQYVNFDNKNLTLFYS